jgi:hypothetical protein
MKKIRNIAHLDAEKKKLSIQRLVLENAIQSDWQELKKTLKPGRFAGNIFSGFLLENRKGQGKGFIETTAAGLLTGLAEIMAERAAAKIGTWFKKKANHTK